MNEQTLLRKYKTQETKKKHLEEDKRIYYEISKFFNEGKVLLLDETLPEEGVFDRIINDKSASAITITYKTIFRDNYTEQQLRKQLIYTLNKIGFNKNIPFETMLIPDIDINGNYHYHGVVIMPIKYRPAFKKLITLYIGFMKFDYINDIEGWKKYCYKPDIFNKKEIAELQIYQIEATKEP